MKEVIKAFIKNICIIALILFLEQILVSEKCDGIFSYGLQKWIIKTNALVVEDRSLLISVVVLFLQIIQIDIGIIMLIVLGVKALKIIVSFAFMSRRTYQFSDMYYVTNAVYKEIYRNLLHLNKGKMFTHDKNFQK